MCLSCEWFDQADERKKQWDREGLSLDEAEELLSYYHTTIFPVACEAAEYIEKNWTRDLIEKLDNERQLAFQEIKTKHIDRDSLEDENWQSDTLIIKIQLLTDK